MTKDQELERLSEPNMNRPAWLAQEGAGRSGEGGRVDQIAVIYSERPERRVDSHSDADCICHIAEPEIVDALEDVAEVIEWHEPQPAGQRITQFEVENAKRVASERDQRRQYAGTGLRGAQGLVASVQRVRRRLDDGLRACRLDPEAAQSRRAAREEPFADRQTTVVVVNHPIFIAVRGVDGRGQADASGEGQSRIAQQRCELAERFEPLISGEEFVE